MYCRSFGTELVHFTSDTPEIDDDDQYNTFVYVYLAYDDSMAIDGTQCVVPKRGVKGQCSQCDT